MNRYFIFILLVCSTAYADSQQRSGVTADEMITNVRSDYREETDSRFSDSLLLKYLNDGMRGIAAATKSIEGTEEVTLQDDTIEYPITRDYINVDAVTIKKNTGEVYALRKGSVNEVNLSIGGGDTDDLSFWYEFDGKVGVYPVETVADEDAEFGGDDVTLDGDDVTFGNERITLYLKEKSYDIIQSDTIKTPANTDNQLKSYMLYRAAFADRKSGLYRHYWNQFEAGAIIYRTDQEANE